MGKHTQPIPISTHQPTDQNAIPKENTKRRTENHRDDNLHPAFPCHRQGGDVQPLTTDTVTTKVATNRQQKTTAQTAKLWAPQSSSQPTPDKVQLEQEFQGMATGLGMQENKHNLQREPKCSEEGNRIQQRMTVRGYGQDSEGVDKGSL